MMYVGKYNVEYLGKINEYEGVIIDKFSGDTRIKHIKLYFVVDKSISLKELLKSEKCWIGLLITNLILNLCLVYIFQK